MWWNYRKPRPLTVGAFKFAAENKVPVLPMFITMEDSDKIGPDGFPIQKYTLNIMPAIYPDKEKTVKENMVLLRDKNYAAWKDCYESFYGIPLVYETEDEAFKSESPASGSENSSVAENGSSKAGGSSAMGNESSKTGDVSVTENVSGAGSESFKLENGSSKVGGSSAMGSESSKLENSSSKTGAGSGAQDGSFKTAGGSSPSQEA